MIHEPALAINPRRISSSVSFMEMRVDKVEP